MLSSDGQNDGDSVIFAVVIASDKVYTRILTILGIDSSKINIKSHPSISSMATTDRTGFIFVPF